MQASIGNWVISIERKPYTAIDLAEKYDVLSPSWDHTISRLGFGRAYAGLFEHLNQEGYARALSEQCEVLDAGIGTGTLSYAMATEFGTDFRLHGIDISNNMLDEASSNLRALGINPTLRTGDASRLPYEDAQFNWVMTAHMLEHLETPYDGLAELTRVTKSGGTVMLVMTRKSIIGHYIDFKWRLNRVSDATLIYWMQSLGLSNIQSHRLGGPIWSNWMSMVFTATKS